MFRLSKHRPRSRPLLTPMPMMHADYCLENARSELQAAMDAQDARTAAEHNTYAINELHNAIMYLLRQVEPHNDPREL